MFDEAALPVDQALSALRKKHELSQRFQLIAPNNLLYSALFSAIKEIISKLDNITLDIHANNKNQLLSQTNFDLALRVGEQKDSSYYQRRLGTIATALVAKKDTQPNDILFLPFGEHQIGSIEPSLSASFKKVSHIDDISIVRRLVEAGLGVGMLPMTEICQLSNHSLYKYIETDAIMPKRPLYVLWHGSRKPTKNGKLVIDIIHSVTGDRPEFCGERLLL
ncbi:MULTISPECIES: LysR substrate-binding domain-containing protein [Idiomarina]|uniref:LysR substrate-binding domain-containing protein n=1 Tax=Idiomarina TaxID=135575 RepID=UPI001FB8339A|nr:MULTISPECIES: LysR substrate-binding domain-containing protein [Idiomarina]